MNPLVVVATMLVTVYVALLGVDVARWRYRRGTRGRYVLATAEQALLPANIIMVAVSVAAHLRYDWVLPPALEFGSDFLYLLAVLPVWWQFSRDDDDTWFRRTGQRIRASLAARRLLPAAQQ